MNKPISMSECFSAGIRALRDKKWTGKQQKDIAQAIGYTESHLAQVMNGKREPGIQLQEKLARAYGMNADDVIRIGRGILEGRGFLPFIGQIENLPPHSEEQATKIVALTMRQYGLDGCLVGYRPRGWSEFLTKDLTAGQFHESVCAEMEVVVEAVKRRLSSREGVGVFKK